MGSFKRGAIQVRLNFGRDLDLAFYFVIMCAIMRVIYSRPTGRHLAGKPLVTRWGGDSRNHFFESLKGDEGRHGYIMGNPLPLESEKKIGSANVCIHLFTPGVVRSFTFISFPL
jgi:hypothetical protein